MAESWDIDPKTGDYKIDSQGKPVVTKSLTVPAYFRLKIKRTQWLFAPDTGYGSDFYLVKKRKTGNDTTFLENIGAAALAPIIADGRATDISVTTTTATQSGVGLQATIIDAGGEPVTLNLPTL